jgi:hypothetical protein
MKKITSHGYRFEPHQFVATSGTHDIRYESGDALTEVGRVAEINRV